MYYAAAMNVDSRYRDECSDKCSDIQGWSVCMLQTPEEGEVGEGSTTLHGRHGMAGAGGSLFNELFLWSSITTQPKCAGLG